MNYNEIYVDFGAYEIVLVSLLLDFCVLTGGKGTNNYQ